MRVIRDQKISQNRLRIVQQHLECKRRLSSLTDDFFNVKDAHMDDDRSTVAETQTPVSKAHSCYRVRIK